MKAITIKEPYVTAYRGEIYIHTAKTVMPDPVDGCSHIFPLGHIVLKANLTDCIYMNKEFIDEVKKDPDEIKFGFYSIGRYAWKLENTEILAEPISARGQLGIWNW